MKIFDFHCHVYPEAAAEKISQSVANFYHVVRGRDIPDLNGSLSCVLEAQAEAGITKTLLSSAATTPFQVRHVNEFLARAAHASDGRCLALGTLHPRSNDVEGDLEHLLDLGLLGIKLHPDMQGFALDELSCMKMFEAAGGRLPFLIHTGDRRFQRSNPDQLIPALTRFPETIFIGGHMGGFSNWIPYAERLIAGHYPNLYVDCSSTACAVDRQKFVELIRGYGAKQVLFGTDYPMWQPKEELDKILALPLTGEEQRMILWENAIRLLKLS